MVALVYLLAFCSGLAALVYEVTWAKMLSLTFGSTTLSAAAVIAGFMGGMGLGAWLYHLVYERVGRALVIYAGLEIGIAVTTAVLTRTFYWLPQLFAQASEASSLNVWLGAGRIAVVLGLLVVPAGLMGATFPALCTVMIHTARGVDRHLGMIYGINTIGAAAGALLAGMVLIERLGLSDSVGVANLVNVAVGLVALALAVARGRRGGAAAAPSRAGETAIPSRLPWWLTGLVLFVSGFTTLSYEVLWFRALRYMVGNSTYAFTVVLVIFLVGLGLGSLLLGRMARRASPDGDLGLCQCGIAVLAVGGMLCYWLALSFPSLRDWISIFSAAAVARPWWVRLLLDAGLAAVTMLPATLFMGLSFPLASKLYLGDVRRLGRRVGGAYLLANLGSILGAVLAAVLLLPFLGTLGGTKLAAVINLVLGLGVLLYSGRRLVSSWAPVVAATAIVVALLVILPGSLTLHGEGLDERGEEVIFVEEGDLATVQVLEEARDPAYKTMTVDGCRIGCSSAYRGRRFHRKQVMLAHLPMVLEGRIRQTLNIGLGSGSTLKALAAYGEVELLDCVEISAAVVRGARLFEEAAVLEDPRVTLIVDDAVHYLLRTDRQYDLIISDGKQNPFSATNAPLLCREFYEYSLARLSERGLFVQWMSLTSLPGDLRVNLRTLAAVFPYLEVFFFPGESVFMVGSREPLAGRPQMSGEQFVSSPAGEDLEAYYIPQPAALLSRWVASKPQFQSVLGEGPVSTWDHLLLDFSAFKASGEERARATLENLGLLLAAEEATSYVASSRLIRRAFAAMAAGRRAEARWLARQALAANPEDAAAQALVRVIGDPGQRSRPRGG